MISSDPKFPKATGLVVFWSELSCDETNTLPKHGTHVEERRSQVVYTSVGRKFAPVEGLSHDLVGTGSIYHVHFAWQVWHGQLSPRPF